MCLSYAYLIPDLGYKYVNNFQNNATHISSVVMDVETVVRCILYLKMLQTELWNIYRLISSTQEVDNSTKLKFWINLHAGLSRVR